MSYTNTLLGKGFKDKILKDIPVEKILKAFIPAGKSTHVCNDSNLTYLNSNKWLQPQRDICTQPMFVSVSVIWGKGRYIQKCR